MALPNVTVNLVIFHREALLACVLLPLVIKKLMTCEVQVSHSERSNLHLIDIRVADRLVM